MPYFDVFYMRAEFSSIGIQGAEHCKCVGRMPSPQALGKTHVYLRMQEAPDLEGVFAYMQKHVFTHLNMTIGDIIVDELGDAYMIDLTGFHKLEGQTA